MEAERLQHPITVEEYDRMAKAGVFGDARIELIDGRLIDVPPQEPPHSGTLFAFQYRMQSAFGQRAAVRPQMPLPVGDHSEPEPDLALVRWDPEFYRNRHPSARETFAVIEVAHTSLAFDRNVKRRLYGAARIPEYWIANLDEKIIEVHLEPHDLGYARHEERRRGESISFEAFPDVTFSVDELVG